jgi:hypothetical protein
MTSQSDGGGFFPIVPPGGSVVGIDRNDGERAQKQLPFLEYRNFSSMRAFYSMKAMNNLALGNPQGLYQPCGMFGRQPKQTPSQQCEFKSHSNEIPAPAIYHAKKFLHGFRSLGYNRTVSCLPKA